MARGIGQKVIYRGVQQGLLKFPDRKEAAARAKANGKFKKNIGFGGRTHSPEAKSRLRETALRNGLGGTTNSKKNPYVTVSGETVFLDSSYETKIATDLDIHQVLWSRPKRKPWTDNDGKQRFYTADFYLPEYDVYLDPKNDYLITKDLPKILAVQEQNNIRVLILDSTQLSWEEVQKLL